MVVRRCLIALIAIVPMLVAFSCANPYDMTNDLKGKTLVYSSSPESKQTFKFSSDGKSGSYEYEEYTYQYPDAASVGVYAKMDWVKTDGGRATFTYDSKTHEIVFTYTHVYKKIPGTTTSYAEDYREYACLDYEKAVSPGITAITETRTRKLLFNQDSVVSVYVAAGADQWAHTNNYSCTYTISGTAKSYNDSRVEKLTVGSDMILENIAVDREYKTGAYVTGSEHWRYDTDYKVYAAYRIGDTKEDEVFADMWKKDNGVTFRSNQVSYVQKEWEGTSEPAAPSVSTATGIGSNGGTPNNDPLNYYYIDRTTDPDTTTFNLLHYGDFITYRTSSASRSLGR